MKTRTLDLLQAFFDSVLSRTGLRASRRKQQRHAVTLRRASPVDTVDRNATTLLRCEPRA